MPASHLRCLLEESQQDICCFYYSFPFRLQSCLNNRGGGKEHSVLLAHSLIFPSLALASNVYAGNFLSHGELKIFAGQIHLTVHGIPCRSDTNSNFMVIKCILSFFYWILSIVTLF